MKLLKIAFSLSIINLVLFMVLAAFPNDAPTVSVSKPSLGPTMSALPSTKPSVQPVNSSISVTQANPTKTSDTSVPTSVPTSAPPTPDNRCIIVIDGNQYDVTSFKNQHSGGDIFQCGTDMSSIFHNQHDNSYLSSLKRI